MKGYVFSMCEKTLSSELLGDGEEISGDGFVFWYDKSDKFKDDKLFFKRDGIVCLLDGVILNKEELMNNCMKSWEDTVLGLIKDDKLAFIYKLRGNFSAIIFDENEKKVWAFSDFIGSKGIFYYIKDNALFVTSHLRLVAEIIERYNGEKITPFMDGCQEMLLVGAPMNGNTVLDGVRRLLGGKYICYDLVANKLLEERYHIFKNLPEHDMTLDEAIDECDKLFRKAVDRIYKKNDEYGYCYLADLSGGLDSRLVNWVANDLGYKNVLNICWSMEKKADHVISKKIAKRLENNYFFYTMNKGEDILCDVDTVINKTGGVVNYFMGTGVNRLLDNVDLSNIGMEITGLLGELHNAYWVEGDKHTSPKYIGNSFFSRGIDFKCPSKYTEEYENFEQMQLYEYSVILWLSGVFVRHDRVEVCSPYVDKDFLEFAYSIPLKWRLNHYFTMAWMCKKYPEAAEFLWQAEMKPVEAVFNNRLYLPKVLFIAERSIARVYNKICRLFNINSGLAYLNEMNPIHIWFAKEKNVRIFYEEYYLKYIDLVKEETLREEMNEMMKSKVAINQLSVINLLSIYRLYFS